MAILYFLQKFLQILFNLPLASFFHNFSFIVSFSFHSAKKGKDTREEMAEVRMDPDIEDVNREPSRSGELFVLRWVFSYIFPGVYFRNEKKNSSDQEHSIGCFVDRMLHALCKLKT